MAVNPYLGHPSQLCGVEEMRLVGGKGDGMRLFQIRNAAGLMVTVNADRCADIPRISFKGDNIGFFSPCGYVAPAYYDKDGLQFLKSFTAGFMTTCGFANAGGPTDDGGEVSGLHGTIGNTPCDKIWWTEDDDAFQIHAEVSDSTIFGRKLVLRRTLTVGKWENRLTVSDTVENEGDAVSPLMLLYHVNMGYPLLSETAVFKIPSSSFIPATQHAADGLAEWDQFPAPIANFEEQCYFHSFDGMVGASIYNPDIKKGLEICGETDTLDALTEWKMPGVRDYVLGLEPGNCHPIGRGAAREQGKLKFIEPGQKQTFRFSVRFFEEPLDAKA